MSGPVNSALKIRYDTDDLVLEGVVTGNGKPQNFLDTQGEITIDQPSLERLVLTFADISSGTSPIYLTFASEKGEYVLSSGQTANRQ
jgi:hypothetical protein